MKYLIALLLSAVTIRAASVTLAWDANTESDLVGYKVYYGQASRGYTTNIVINGGTNTTTTVSNLNTGRWYFAVVAKNTNGLESDFSNEVSYGISPPRNLRITASIQSASTIDGPWRELAATAVPVAPTNSFEYFRTVLYFTESTVLPRDLPAPPPKPQ